MLGLERGERLFSIRLAHGLGMGLPGRSHAFIPTGFGRVAVAEVESFQPKGQWPAVVPRRRLPQRLPKPPAEKGEE